MTSPREWAEVLTAVELHELELVHRGLIDSALTLDEITAVIHAALASTGDLSTSPRDVLDDLVSGKVVLEHDGVYRSRMAETLRVLARLRQGFRGDPISNGKPLVMDYRLVHKRRSRPRAECSIDDLAHAAPRLTPLQLATLGYLLPGARVDAGPISTASRTLYRYQIDSAAAVLRALATDRTAAVLISAGTGAGKSLAYYLPALLDVVGLVANDTASWTKALSLYPRRELLRDQFNDAVAWADQIYQSRQLSRPLRVGAWLGGVPKTHQYELPDEWELRFNGKSRDASSADAIFPFADCPRCGKELLWRTGDRRSGIERLGCSNTRCGYVTPDKMVGLTRASLSAEPPDIMFSTTESLNRQLGDTGSHGAFGLSGARRLRMVLVDEIHTYEGLTGAQNGYLFRRLAHQVASPLVWVGLSATLANPQSFTSQVLGVPTEDVAPISPADASLDVAGAEYLLALRHDPSRRTSALSLTIQASMALSRSLDPPPRKFGRSAQGSDEMFGQKLFVFTDKLDVTNRMYWSLLDAEGWYSPGKPRSKYKPLTLAHLRSEHQDKAEERVRESAVDRDALGQWWWMASVLGHELENDEQRIVDRVSSQESGSIDSADIVIATASLEVGISDSRVGAVIQHKAPGSASRYIQRKGRAGRRTHTRPWTVVVLSDFGRDRFAWQTYDQLLDPILRDQHLPMRNRYVQRIQAVYATLDWLALQTADQSDVTSTWADLAGPAELLHEREWRVARRLERQQRAAALIEAVLAHGAEYELWQRHVKRALGLTDADFDALLVNPPRPLLLSVLPTMQRRLETQWRDEVPDKDDSRLQYRAPVPEFAPSSLFADLVSTEVSLIVPTSPGFGRAVENRFETLPVARILREFLPGNATRHFGHLKTDRHWVAIALDGDDEQHVTFDLLSAYRTNVIGTVLTRDGSRVPLHVPTSVRLDLVPETTDDATSMTPNWESNLEAVGQGRTVDVDQTSLGECIETLTVHLHEFGDAVRVVRFATGGAGRAFSQSGAMAVTLDLETGGRPAALGFEYEADGFSLRVREVSQRELAPWERSDYAADLLVDLQGVVPGFTVFDADRIYQAIEQSIAFAVVVDQVSVSDAAEWDAAKVVNCVAAAHLNVEDDDEHHAAERSDRLSLADERVSAAVVDAWKALLGVPPADVTRWQQRRLAASLGAAFLEASVRLVPETDPDDVQIDIDADGRRLWISELSPGGNGHIGAIAQELWRSPRLFADVIETLARPGEFELRAGTIDASLTALAADDRGVVGQMIAAWPLGHAAVRSAFDELSAYLRSHGVAVETGLTTMLSARFLGPGCASDDIRLSRAVLDWIKEAEGILGFQPQTRNLIMGASRALDSAVPRRAGESETERQRLLDLLMWPRGREAARHDLAARGLYGSLPAADRHALAAHVAVRHTVIDLDPSAPEAPRHRLVSDGAVEVAVDESQLADLRSVIITSQVEPVEVGGLHLFAQISGLDLTTDRPAVRVHLEEGLEWSD